MTENFITVTTPTTSVNASVTKDLSQYYSQLAKDWANKTNGSVDGVEYSAKYYSQLAEIAADSAEGEAQNVINASTQAQEDIRTNTETAITEIEGAKDGAIDNINTAKTDVISDIESLSGQIEIDINNGLADINTAKNNAISDVNTQGQEIVNEATTEANRAAQAANDAEEALAGVESKWSMFDVVEKDRILSYEESRGYSLLGTYVYKNPVSGSRYGYPDFYNKCLEEYNEGGKTSLQNNVDIVGTPTVDNGVISGFSADNYCTIPGVPSDITSYEMVIKFTTPSQITQTEYIMGSAVEGGLLTKITVQVNSDGTYKCTAINFLNYLTHQVIAAFAVELNTTYWLKLVWDNTNYTFYSYVKTDIDEGWTLVKELNPMSCYWDQPQILGMDYSYSGNSAFSGSIDLKDCYININGERWWTGAKTAVLNSNGHKFYDIADKVYYDEMYNTTGEAWYYGIDTENERIFLPRTTRSQYTINAGEVGQYQEAGLPNIIGSIQAINGQDSALGAFSKTTFDNMYTNDNNNSTYWCVSSLNFDASDSSNTYGNSETVTPAATKKLLYMVVGNVDVSEAQTVVTEITTTENDTIPLFTSIYQDNLLNHPSWLRSEGQWNDGNVYETAYNELVNCLTNNPCNLPVVESSTEFTDYDFVVNQTDMTFRLPLKSSDVGSYLYFKVANAVENLELLNAGEIAESLVNKADVDLANANPSQSFINKSIAWSAPDYEAVVDIGQQDFPYTATREGYYFYSLSKGTAAKSLIMKVNGAKVDAVNYSSTYSSAYGLVYLSVGDVVTKDGTATSYDAFVSLFYPPKGGN